MGQRAVRKALADLDIQSVHSVEELVDAVRQVYGKPIHLEALDEANWGPLTAFLEEVAEYVTIYYRIQDTPQYRLQCICHELGHLVLGTACALTVDEHLAEQVEVPACSIRLQARDLRDTDVERQAEEFSFAVIRRLREQLRGRTRCGEALA
ncbi:hypothetical protein HQQ80_06080 [Microbacteriaceae bacterium VKM Ac-2855]|nr:hypothetical protein [Microbacteriaceae bacterium VKM Ac-2855]